MQMTVLRRISTGTTSLINLIVYVNIGVRGRSRIGSSGFFENNRVSFYTYTRMGRIGSSSNLFFTYNEQGQVNVIEMMGDIA
jgi:hypothetical protein